MGVVNYVEEIARLRTAVPKQGVSPLRGVELEDWMLGVAGEVLSTLPDNPQKKLAILYVAAVMVQEFSGLIGL